MTKQRLLGQLVFIIFFYWQNSVHEKPNINCFEFFRQLVNQHTVSVKFFSVPSSV
jgi:hypothetical protein